MKALLQTFKQLMLLTALFSANMIIYAAAAAQPPKRLTTASDKPVTTLTLSDLQAVTDKKELQGLITPLKTDDMLRIVNDYKEDQPIPLITIQELSRHLLALQQDLRHKKFDEENEQETLSQISEKLKIMDFDQILYNKYSYLLRPETKQKILAQKVLKEGIIWEYKKLINLLQLSKSNLQGKNNTATKSMDETINYYQKCIDELAKDADIINKYYPKQMDKDTLNQYLQYADNTIMNYLPFDWRKDILPKTFAELPPNQLHKLRFNIANLPYNKAFLDRANTLLEYPDLLNQDGELQYALQIYKQRHDPYAARPYTNLIPKANELDFIWNAQTQQWQPREQQAAQSPLTRTSTAEPDESGKEPSNDSGPVSKANTARPDELGMQAVPSSPDGGPAHTASTAMPDELGMQAVPGKEPSSSTYKEFFEAVPDELGMQAVPSSASTDGRPTDKTNTAVPDKPGMEAELDDEPRQGAEATFDNLTS